MSIYNISKQSKKDLKKLASECISLAMFTRSVRILEDTLCGNESEETSCDDESLATNLNSVIEENYDVFKSELEKCDYQETKKTNLTRDKMLFS